MNIKDLLIKHEGLRLKPYRDSVGKLTIGVGRNLDDVGISTNEAMMLLENDINKAVLLAQSAFPWFSLLNDARKMVVVSMIFNMGLSNFLEFKKTIEAIQNNDFNKAADEMLSSRWAFQVGKRSFELSQMMRSGVC